MSPRGHEVAPKVQSVGSPGALPKAPRSPGALPKAIGSPRHRPPMSPKKKADRQDKFSTR